MRNRPPKKSRRRKEKAERRLSQTRPDSPRRESRGQRPSSKSTSQQVNQSTKSRLLALLASARAQGLSFQRVQEAMGQSVSRDLLKRLVDSLVVTGRIVRLARGKLVNPEPMGWVVGRLTLTKKGIGFVMPEGSRFGEDLLIPKRGLGTAMDGDRVAAQVVGKERGREIGSVVEILDRAHGRVVGQYFHGPRQATVVPRNRRLGRPIHVPALPRAEARDGMWVTVEVSDWTAGEEPLFGRVADVLGEEGEPDVDLPVILAAYGVRPEFPEETLREVEQIPLEISPATIARRRDLRDLTIFTIDPATAKDFDDALSVEPLGEARWRLGVHIADVAEHVRLGTALDAAAGDRGTSIYPVDKVIPMLPPRLSDLVCSLRPDEDKLTLSVFLVIDEHGDAAEKPDLCESIIRSRRRLDYGQVQRFFDGALSEEEREFVAPVAADLAEIQRVARALMAMRRRRGALDLDLPEVEILLDEDRRVREIARRERWESHRLVEECMLAANEAVAWHLFRREIPSVYRDHDPPDGQKLSQLLPVLRSLGVKERINVRHLEPRDYQRLLQRTEGLAAQRIIHRLLLRTLMLAVYDPENRGHFGLASACYTHFTSPIRRYPDLLVHRILKSRLRGEALPEGVAREVWEEELSALAKLSSERERRAQKVERDMIALKTLQFIEPRLGEEMTGIVSGVAVYGFWVELDEVPIEGFVHVSTLDPDWYEYDEELHVLRGEESGDVWRLGQGLRVRLSSVDFNALELSLAVVEKL
jgi:ribonuclease R